MSYGLNPEWPTNQNPIDPKGSDVLHLEVDLTNDEMLALEPKLAEVETQLVKKLQGAEHQPHSKLALAYAAWRHLIAPILAHLAALREKPQPRRRP